MNARPLITFLMTIFGIVTALPQVRVGDAAVIYDKDLNRISELAGTITDEMVCRISPRVPRVYWENGVRLP